LIVVLLNQRPEQFKAELLQRLDRIDESTLNPVAESVLVFALKQPQLLQQLITRGAAVDRAHDFGKTPLFYAIENNDAAAVRLLLSKGADVEPYLRRRNFR
jgi:uncharacterized protein